MMKERGFTQDFRNTKDAYSTAQGLNMSRVHELRISLEDPSKKPQRFRTEILRVTEMLSTTHAKVCWCLLKKQTLWDRNTRVTNNTTARVRLTMRKKVVCTRALCTIDWSMVLYANNIFDEHDRRVFVSKLTAVLRMMILYCEKCCCSFRGRTRILSLIY